MRAMEPLLTLSTLNTAAASERASPALYMTLRKHVMSQLDKSIEFWKVMQGGGVMLTEERGELLWMLMLLFVA